MTQYQLDARRRYHLQYLKNDPDGLKLDISGDTIENLSFANMSISRMAANKTTFIKCSFFSTCCKWSDFRNAKFIDCDLRLMLDTDSQKDGVQKINCLEC